MSCTLYEAVLGQLHLSINRTSEESTLSTDYQLAGVERLLNRTVGRGLGDLTQLRGGRVLTLSQTVDLVVEQNNIEVYVTTDSVNEVVTTDCERVAVTGSYPNAQVGVSGLNTGCDSVSTTVNGVHTVATHVVGETRRATDTRDYGEHLVGNVLLFGYFGQCFQHRVEDSVVTATGTPFYLLIALEICRSIFICTHNYLANNSLNLSFNSTTVKG